MLHSYSHTLLYSPCSLNHTLAPLTSTILVLPKYTEPIYLLLSLYLLLVYTYLILHTYLLCTPTAPPFHYYHVLPCYFVHVFTKPNQTPPPAYITFRLSGFRMSVMVCAGYIASPCIIVVRFKCRKAWQGSLRLQIICNLVQTPDILKPDIGPLKLTVPV